MKVSAGAIYDHLVIDTRSMLRAIAFEDVLSFQGIYRYAMNLEKPCFYLPKNLTVTLVISHSIPMRHTEVTQAVDQPIKRCP